MKVEIAEVKTPLKPPKKYRKGKKSADDAKVEEFMSFGSSSYFNVEAEDEDATQNQENSKDPNSSYQIERRIEEWLNLKDIIKAHPGEKKELFFEDKRIRVNSISFIGHLKDSDEIHSSSLKTSSSLTPPSLHLTPESSKICQKRSSFASMLEITTKKSCSAFGNEDQDDCLDFPRWRKIQSHPDQRDREQSRYQEHSLRELSPAFNKNF